MLGDALRHKVFYLYVRYPATDELEESIIDLNRRAVDAFQQAARLETAYAAQAATERATVLQENAALRDRIRSRNRG